MLPFGSSGRFSFTSVVHEKKKKNGAVGVSAGERHDGQPPPPNLRTKQKTAYA